MNAGVLAQFEPHELCELGVPAAHAYWSSIKGLDDVMVAGVDSVLKETHTCMSKTDPVALEEMYHGFFYKGGMCVPAIAGIVICAPCHASADSCHA